MHKGDEQKGMKMDEKNMSLKLSWEPNMTLADPVI